MHTIVLDLNEFDRLMDKFNKLMAESRDDPSKDAEVVAAYAELDAYIRKHDNMHIIYID